ncbi:hypothetical protein D3C72_1144410 [compost metagenome]
MPTFKPIVQDKKSDGTYNVKIRITHNRTVRRIPTSVHASSSDLTRTLKIKNQGILDLCEDLIRQCRDVINKIGFEVSAMSIDELVERIKVHLKGGDKFTLDFFSYTKEQMEGRSAGSAKNYSTMLNALKRFIKRDYLDISEINRLFLLEFEQFLENEPSLTGKNRKSETVEIKQKGGRAVSSYLACIRAIHNLAKAEYNDEDRGIILIPGSPFKNFKIKPQPKTRKRAINIDVIQEIINLPYEEEKAVGKLNRVNLAKDCFLLSFALIGMNNTDMFYCSKPKGNLLIYNRRKTAGRREDNAEMHVRIEPCIKNLVAKYNDNEKLFRFSKHYKNQESFNKAVHKGLKIIGEKLGIDNLTFYAARHSWATIARSAKVGIDKATVHEALNHVDADMKVTDIYIDRDWSVIWNSNEKVLNQLDWESIIQ